MDRDEISGTEVVFKNGIPGFEELRNFLVSRPLKNYPFFSLQSLENQHVSFLTLSTFEVARFYEFELPPSIVEYLEVNDISEVAVLNIINMQGDINNATVNLKAPLIINIEKNKGMQVVLDDNSLKLKEPLIKMIREMEGK